MKVADTFERRVLGMARVVCLIMFAGALAAMIAVIFALFASGPAQGVSADPPVSAVAVLSQIPGSESQNDALTKNPDVASQVPNVVGLAVPQPIQQVLSDGDTDQPTLNNWLGDVPPADRQQFLNELSAVVTLADRHAASWEWDDRQRYIAAAMSQYALTKIDRVDAAERQIAARAERTDQFRMSLGTLMAFSGLLTLLLVLMSIERNTRSMRREHE